MLPGTKYKPEDFVRIAWRGKWIILLPALLGFGAAFAWAQTLQDRYRSEAHVLIVPQRVPTSFVQSTVTTRLEERLNAISQQILSRTRLEALIQEFNLYPDQRKELPLEDVIIQMRRDVGIEIPKVKTRNQDPGYFNVRFDASSPRTAQQVASKLASFFIDENLQSREGQANLTNEFLGTQLAEAKTKLVEHEKKLEAYRRKYGAEMPTQVTSNVQVMSATQVQLQALTESAQRDQERLATVRRLLLEADAIQASTASAPQAEPLANNKGPTTAAQQLQTARAALQALQLRLTPQHPDVVRAQRAVRELEQKAEAEALLVPVSPNAPVVVQPSPAEILQRRRITELQAEQDMLQTRLATTTTQQGRLQEILATVRDRLEAAPTRETELTELMRDYQTLKDTYTSLLTKSQESNIAANLERRQIGEQFRLIDAAQLPQRPIYPNRTRYELMGLAAGLALGVAIIALLEYRDTTFATDGDLVLSLAVPVLAVVPTMQTERERRRGRRIRRVVWATAVVVVLGAGGLIAWKMQLIETLVR